MWYEFSHAFFVGFESWHRHERFNWRNSICMTFILSPSFFLKLKKSCLKFDPRKMNIYVLGTGTGIATKQSKIDANRHLIVDVSINEEFTLQYLIAFCATVKFNSRCKVFNKDLTGLNSATGSEKESERLTSINKLVEITSICRAQLCEYHVHCALMLECLTLYLLRYIWQNDILLILKCFSLSLTRWNIKMPNVNAKWKCFCG